MIAIKFNDNGQVVSWKYPCADLDKLRPSAKGFRIYEWDGADSDIPFLKDVNGDLVVSESEKQAAQKAYEKSEIIYMLKAELTKIKEDIEQETFGLIRDDFPQKKARAAEIVNELRVLEGKAPREVNV